MCQTYFLFWLSLCTVLPINVRSASLSSRLLGRDGIQNYAGLPFESVLLLCV